MLTQSNSKWPTIIDFDQRNIWEKVQDGWTITMKQNVRLQGEICPDKLQLDQIQNGRLTTIIDFNICDIHGRLC